MSSQSNENLRNFIVNNTNVNNGRNVRMMTCN